MKYEHPGDQGEVLPNLLGLSTTQQIAEAEFEGFTEAEIILTEELDERTRFNVAYIQRIHRLALGHLYAFAGKWRDVNLSKGGFSFPAARFLPGSMDGFQREVLDHVSDGTHQAALVHDIAIVHAELLFIHPFREGNGRAARILANVMCRRAGHGPLRWELIGEREFKEYVAAVQGAALKDHAPMERIIRAVFPA